MPHFASSAFACWLFYLMNLGTLVGVLPLEKELFAITEGSG